MGDRYGQHFHQRPAIQEFVENGDAGHLLVPVAKSRRRVVHREDRNTVPRHGFPS